MCLCYNLMANVGDCPQAIRELQNMGIRVVMLTGDNERTARAIGAQAGVDDVIAGVLPDGKESVIRSLKEQGKVAMVGDGINDAPALTRADMGIAIGAGTDIAIVAADVVLMKSRLSDVPAAIRMSRATLRNIHENLFWAFFYNVIGIPLAAGIWYPLFGLKLNPMFGAAAMSLSSFCVVTNALRLNLFKMYDASKDKKIKHKKESKKKQEESTMKKKMTFALCFCNRGFMPGELIYGARDDMVKAVTDAGYDYIMMDKELTRYGGVETRDEGLLYAKWLKEHEGQYDGVIFSMPIFADENGAITALQDAGVPILMQAYPDEIGKMDFAHRRDAYCGKFSVTDVFCQYNVPFTVLKPHVVHPLSAKFQENLRDFAAICRVVNGMKRFNLGCIGARTTAFKTVRFDELAMQKNGINVESFDLSEVFEKVRAKADDDAVVMAKLEHLKNYTDFSKVPAFNALTLAKVSVVLDEYIEEYHLDALALRCWNEMETYLRICPCVLLSELNDRGIVASCEIDMCSAISMRAMSLASEGPAAVLDWNNNYGDDEDKIILFHCGPVAQSLMAGKGTVTEHKMFAKNDPGSGWGCNEGRIKPMPITISNCQTKDGKIVIYASEAKFTDDPIEDGYFGCGGVAEIPHLQDKCITLAKGGFKHHTAICEGHYKDILKEAFTTYLGYEWVDIDR